jgi:hypothetical protein
MYKKLLAKVLRKTRRTFDVLKLIRSGAESFFAADDAGFSLPSFTPPHFVERDRGWDHPAPLS